MNESDWDELYSEDWLTEDELIPDEWIEDELAEGDVLDQEQYDTSEVHYAYEEEETEWDQIISPDFKAEMEEYAEIINRDTEGMSQEEAEKYMEFAWGALIGPLVSALAPVAIKAVGGLINKGSRNRRRSRQRRPPRRQSTPRQPAPRQPTRRTASQGTSSAARTALQALTSLLQNPQLIQALTRLASSGESELTYLGPYNTPVREAAIVNAIAEFARDARMELADHEDEDGEDYLKDETGEFLVDPSRPEMRAEMLLELLNEN